MMRLFLCLLSITLSLAPLRAQEVEIPATQFFETFKGNYEIITAGSESPKEDNKVGSVTIEGNEGLIVLPYCHKTGGVCDPGFRSFPLDTSRVLLDKKEENHWLYTLETLEKDSSRRYRWEYRNQIVHFLDEQYTLPSGEPFPLEFIIEKAPS